MGFALWQLQWIEPWNALELLQPWLEYAALKFRRLMWRIWRTDAMEGVQAGGLLELIDWRERGSMFGGEEKLARYRRRVPQSTAHPGQPAAYKSTH